MTLDVVARADGTELARTWALNEATVEKGARERMVEVVIEIDGRPLSRWGMRRRRLRDADRVHRLRVLGGRTGRLARGRGAAVRADQRARAVRAADGGFAGVGPCGRTIVRGAFADVNSCRSCPGNSRPPLPPGRPRGRRQRRLLCGAMGGESSTCRQARGSRSAAARCRCCWRGRTAPVPAPTPAPAAATRRRDEAAFTDRLVAKFGLPVAGWRGRSRRGINRAGGRGIGQVSEGLGRVKERVMLEEVRITGLGVIDDALLELSPGFTALTGETGAGKTMVVTGSRPAVRRQRRPGAGTAG